jgi:hypothetical protein
MYGYGLTPWLIANVRRRHVAEIACHIGAIENFGYLLLNQVILHRITKLDLDFSTYVHLI